MIDSVPETATGLACGEIDIHYLSVCGSGLISRICLADVAGHGETIAAVGTAMHAHLLRSVDTFDERKVPMDIPSSRFSKTIATGVRVLLNTQAPLTLPGILSTAGR